MGKIVKNGYFGKVLWVDLSKETFEEEELAEELYRQYLGGYGLACKLISERMSAKTAALSPEAIIGFFPGLLTGTSAPFSGRYMVCGKSPLTGGWGDANSGGTFGPEIKRCGYDGILFKGAAKSPKYVALIEGNKEILDASDIWGLGIVEAEDKLKEKHGKFIKTAGIGQAGENLSLISGIGNDYARIAARCGLGAVVGSKKLKMLVLKGKDRVSIDDKATFNELVKLYNATMKKRKKGMIIKAIIKAVPKISKTMRRIRFNLAIAPNFMVKKLWHRFGTTSTNALSVEVGDAPIKNWTGINKDFPSKRYMKLSASAIYKYVDRPYGCFSCPVQCGAILKVPELDLEETHRPEYETCTAFGSNLMNDNLISIFELNELCNRAAIDVISAGATVAFAMECFEKGILTKKDTGGLDLRWGDWEDIIMLVKMMINREGIGDLLADGVKIASKKIGKDSEKFAIHSLGQEIAMHNPRYYNTLAYSYAYNPTPGRHTTASTKFSNAIGSLSKCFHGFRFPKKWKELETKRSAAQALTNCLHQIISSLGLCLFSMYFKGYPGLELVNSLTGWNMKMDDLKKAGMRIFNLKHVFTLREGVDLVNNELNGRVYGEPPFKKGPTKGVTIEYKDYFKGVCLAHGWNPDNGYPLKYTLRDLDLDLAIKDLY
jgi:aldehyde:ferredoxin oxidoreductase